MTNLIKNKKFTRITALLLVVAVIFGTMFTLPVSAASGDKVTITFDYCYDSTGNIIKFQQTTVSDGYTVGTPGEELCKIFADGKEAYCIEPGHTLYSGNTLTESASTVWKNLGSAKQKAINLALLYGKPGSGKNLSGTEDQKWIATQLIVWEFVSGCRSTNDGYKCTNTKFIDGICAGGANPGVKSVYNAISKSLANYSTVPSFASAIASKAEIYEMKYSDGKYTLTLTDSNSILSDFSFKTTGGVSASVSGNKLTLTSSNPVNNVVTFNSAKSMPSVGNTTLVPYGDASLQDVITGVENDADPIRAYFKVKTSSGNLKLVKTSEDGNVANIEFTIKGDGYSKTVKTWICGGGDHCGPESGRGNCFEENHCTDCGDCRDDFDWCEDCNMHIQCAVDNNKHCPDCYECTAEEGCQLCYRCFNCGDVCSDYCDDICLECHRKEGVACENCDTCYVNDDTVFCTTCKLCHNCTGGYCESCGQCGDDVDLCDGCGNYCSECALICPECGENCSECYGVFCPSCYTCDRCATLCVECGYCDNCLNMCLSCERCEDCTSMCQSCHEYCADCVNMCVGCDTCENCADVCKVCQEMCTNCGTICEDCGSCMNCCEANIGYAYVNIMEPVAGAHPEDAVSGSANVSVYSTAWRYGTDFNNTLNPSDTFKAGETYQAVVRLVVDERYSFYDNPIIIVNRFKRGSYTTYTSDSLEFTIKFTVPATAGCTVSGTVTSFNSDTDDVIIQLTESGASEAAYKAIVKGNTASYTIEGVAPGTYTMKVMKQKHVMREYTVTVSAENVTQDVKICLLGDVNMDGTISILDATEVQKAIAGLLSLNEYQNKLADVNIDGSVSIIDATQIQKFIAGLIDKF